MADDMQHLLQNAAAISTLLTLLIAFWWIAVGTPQKTEAFRPWSKGKLSKDTMELLGYGKYCTYIDQRDAQKASKAARLPRVLFILSLIPTIWLLILVM